ncbi:adenylate/guanylate cyclase domain-containing protein [Brevibacterium linens]|uniref:Adenylate and Guanylate cyclase catalytic domain-containing protein n=1 Tax=Brevibacterium linens ATCC 9172 TaxID=1255617 RepID=A0A2H1JRT3_BRELN|nr:adenylate/guanylate cyclase domain-containing protein [Brevibacterium linens]KAB1947279.1 adenylate/guanylate cyclase domain-containing protein [Brevibacterium linens ATCC 9172]SMX89988.1 hypothetical protein BLIN9172_02427 [Brevibacterium linens ATCC 9172]
MAKTDTDIENQISTILNEEWNIRESNEVPSTDSVTHKNGAVKIDAAFLYADLAESTGLQKGYKNTFAAKAIRMYLGGASEIIRHYGGHIKSFDGDRVMGVFAGNRKRNNAVLAAFAINWMVQRVIAPQVKARHDANGTSVWVPRHGIGIDSGETFVARAGVRNKANEHNHNDLVFVGQAPNVAAKLSAIRESASIIVTKNVYGYLDAAQKKKLASDDNPWRGPFGTTVGPYKIDLFKTSYWRSLDA